MSQLSFFFFVRLKGHFFEVITHQRLQVALMCDLNTRSSRAGVSWIFWRFSLLLRRSKR